MQNDPNTIDKEARLETTSPAWLKTEVEKKRKVSTLVSSEIGIVALLLKTSRKPKKAKRMSRIIYGLVSHH